MTSEPSLFLRVFGPRTPGDELRARPSRYVTPTVVLALAALSLFASSFLPVWRMTLKAPQYPKGLTVVAYVDFDPSGWTAIDSMVRHLARFGIEVERVGWLVRPERFTEEELDYVTLPLPGTRKSLDGFVTRTGGVRGKALGIHADHLFPVDRVVEAFQEELRLLGLPG